MIRAYFLNGCKIPVLDAASMAVLDQHLIGEVPGFIISNKRTTIVKIVIPKNWCK